MANVNLRDADPVGRSLAITDYIFGATPGEADAAEAFKTDTITQLIALIFKNPPAAADLTAAEITALRTLLAVLTQAEVDARAAVRFSNSEKAKLAGISAAANRLVPYKLGNIYRALAEGEAVVKPGNAEGVVTVAGITVAPVGWQLLRPEATEALPYVYDCHVYGYETNGVFGVQYGTPNRTDRYIAAVAIGGGGLNQAAVDARVQAGLMAAVQGNTESGIAVTYNADDGTLDFVVGDAQPVVPADPLGAYAAVREVDNQFTTADFTGAEGVEIVGGEFNLPEWSSGNRYMAIAQPTAEEEYTIIKPKFSPFNPINSFGIVPGAPIDIGGADHRVYLYDDQLLPNSSGDAWVVEV